MSAIEKFRKITDVSYIKKALFCTVMIITAIVFTVVIYNNYYNKSYKVNLGDMLSVAVLELLPNNEKLVTDLNNIINSNVAVKELAILKKINMSLVNNNHNEAKQLIEKIINDNTYSELILSFSKIIWLNIAIDMPYLCEADKGKFVEFSNYFDSDRKEFFGTANLIKAIWLIKNQDLITARNTLKNILLSNNTPSFIKDQAQILMSSI